MGTYQPSRDQLDHIRRTRTYKQPWKPLRSHICARISALPFADCGRAMQTKKNILKRLQKFTESPPFTIVRIAELLVDPQAQGYRLDSEIAVEKYLNSLKRVVFVESLIYEFSETARSSNSTAITPKVNSIADLPQAALIDIPWLNKKQILPVNDLDEPENAGIPGNDTDEVSPTEDDKFATLEGAENILESGALEATDHVIKRPRTNSDDMNFNNSSMDMEISSDSMLDSPLESPERGLLSAS